MLRIVKAYAGVDSDLSIKCYLFKDFTFPASF